MSLSSLLYYLCGSSHDISLDPQSLAVIAKKLQVTLNELARSLNTPLPHGAPFKKISRKPQLAHQVWIQICPLCLKEDPVPYLRIDWMNRRVEVCKIHGIQLICKCEYCRSPLIPVGKLKNLTRTVLTWDSPICFCQTCGRDLRGEEYRKTKYIAVDHIGSTPLLFSEEQRWLNAIYIMIETHRLDLRIDPISLQGLRLSEAPTLVQGANEKIIDFFNILMTNLTIRDTLTIDLERLKRFGAACQALRNNERSSSSLSKTIQWLGSILENADERYIIKKFPAVVFEIVTGLQKFPKKLVYVLDYNEWLEIKRDMHNHGCSTGAYDVAAFRWLYREVCLNSNIPKRPRSERAKKFSEDGTFTVFLGSVYRVYKKRSEYYNFHAIWFTQGILEYVRKNNPLVFQSSLDYFSQGYQYNETSQYKYNTSEEYLSNIALSLGISDCLQINDYITQAIYFSN